MTLDDWNQRKLNQSSQRLKDYQDGVRFRACSMLHVGTGKMTLDDWNQRKLNQSSQRLKDYQDLVYRKKAQGKGHRLLFSVGLALFLVFSSLKVNFQSSDGKTHFELHTQLVPLTQLVPCLVLIATALGVNTDPLAELLGRWVSKR